MAALFPPTPTPSPSSLVNNTAQQVDLTCPPMGTNGDFAAVTNVEMAAQLPVSGTYAPVAFQVLSPTHIRFSSGFLPLGTTLVKYRLTSPVAVWSPNVASFTNMGAHDPAPPPAPATRRKAWLTLDSLNVPLDDFDAGYAMMELDLGYPDVRDVVSNRPDLGGIDDRTQYFGGRVITAKLTAWRGGTTTVDDIVDLFAPFMQPQSRPQLHYIKESVDSTERVITVRASGFSAPMSPPFTREVQLQWVAGDPVVRDPTVHSAIAWAGSSTNPGRYYPLTLNRIYPPGGSGSNNAQISSAGDVPIRPFLRIYGPISGPWVYFHNLNAIVGFKSSYVLGAGHWIDVDTARKTAYLDSDPSQPVLNQLTWSSTTWPVIPPLPNVEIMNLFGSNTSSTSQVVATWTDGYLT